MTGHLDFDQGLGHGSIFKNANQMTDYGLIIQDYADDGKMMALIICGRKQNISIQKFDGVWYHTDELATATPPDEHDLQFTEGIINQTGRLSTYRKNQFGEVLCDLQIQFTAVKPGGTILSTLPIGYRPSRYTTVYQTADQVLDVSTYGSILYNGRDTRVNEYMHVQFSFYAVS